MGQDIRQFVLVLSVCVQNKVSNHPSVGLLQPLPILSLTWSHIALDFVSCLPPSRGYTVILTNSPLPGRQTNVFQLTWFLIGGPSLSLIFGRNFVKRSGPLRFFCQVFIPKPMDNVSGANSSLGSCMPTILSQWLAQMCHHLEERSWILAQDILDQS